MDRSQALDREELERFLSSLSDFQSVFPSALIRHHLSRAGFTTDDERVEKYIALAAQKLLADIANDAIAHSRLRSNAPTNPRKMTGKEKITLTTDDLERALREYGVQLRKPPYFADSIHAGAPETSSTGGGGGASPKQVKP